MILTFQWINNEGIPIVERKVIMVVGESVQFTPLVPKLGIDTSITDGRTQMTEYAVQQVENRVKELESSIVGYRIVLSEEKECVK